LQKPKIVSILSVFLLLSSIVACSGRWPFSPLVSSQPGLLTPASLGQSVTLYNRVQYSDVSGSEYFELVLAVDTQEIKLVIMGEFGQRLVTASYDGITLDVQEEQGSRPYKWAYKQLLLDFQLIFWPDTAWLKSREQAHWRLETAGLQRRFFYKNELYTSIDQQVDTDEYQYYNARLDYNLLVKSAPLQWKKATK